MDSLRIESEGLQQFAKEYPSPSGMKITAGVMTIAGMTTADQNGIGTIFQCFNDQVKVDSSGTRETNDSQIRRILQSARTGKVGTKIGTPVANEGNDFRFKNVWIAHVPILAHIEKNVKRIQNATFCSFPFLEKSLDFPGMAEEGGDKKHDPTPRRLEQAREQGQVAKSQDLAAAIVLLLAIVLLMTLGRKIADDLYEYSAVMLSEPLLLIPENQEIDSLKQSTQSLFHETVIKFMKPLSIFFLLLLGSAILANIVQVGFLWLPEKLALDFTRLDPIKGFGRIFSMQSVVRFLMGIVKTVICAMVAWYAVEAGIGEILNLSEYETNQIAAFLVWTLLMIALKVAVALVIIALIDWMYQRWKHMQDLRMTDQEIRDEIKNMIGDPQIISKRRQIQREMAQKQRVQGTPDADVVVTNPTHFSVAIKYDARTMEEPVIVAKGADFLAFQIRKIAAEHGIPVVERKLLARTLFEHVEIGVPITLPIEHQEHMKTLVEVLKYAYNLVGRDFDSEYTYRQRTKRRA